MDTNTIKNALCTLGNELTELSKNWEDSNYAGLFTQALNQNPWFTKASIQLAIGSLGNSLYEDKINIWLSKYTIANNTKPKTIGVVMAGNIPLVGLHDLLCILITGNNVLAKLSSKDMVLYQIIKDILVKVDSNFENRIKFADGPMKTIDAIIATGSDNSARYFEYYFGKYPNIIRKNRNSLAILQGDETVEELECLGDDVFTYFGLGCRNVSFLIVPENYKFDGLFQAFEKFNWLANHNKYVNNYEYQKAIMMMNQIPMFDNGFLLLRKDNLLSSPIGVIHYMHYKRENEVNDFIEVNKHKIQCIVSKTNWHFNTYGLGKAQQPELWDYADNVDTIEFLTNLK